MRLLTTIAIVLAGSAAAAAAPTITNGTVTPFQWSATQSGAVAWVQTGFDGGLPVGASIQVNAATDGSDAGAWVSRATLPGPLTDGSNGVLQLPVADLEGRHLVRVVVPGADGSPLTLGELRLDRSPPLVSSVAIVPNVDGLAGARVDFTLDDAGLSGVDPAAPVVVELFDGAGWLPAAAQPSPGPGRKTARLDANGLSDGAYPLRVTARDLVGNSSPRAAGVLHIDRVAPTVTATLTRAPSRDDPTGEITFTAADAGSGLDPAVNATLVDIDSAAILGTTPNLTGPQTIVASFPGTGTHRVAVEVADRGRQIGRSAILTIDVPAPRTPGASTPPAPSLAPARGLVPRSVRPAPEGIRWASAHLRRFSARRGVRLDSRVVAARTVAEWNATLGTADAGRYEAYTTFTGTIALGPRATRGLETLAARRHCLHCRHLGRVDADRIVTALQITLHESIHATGPAAPDDYRADSAGRNLEEALAEAAANDLLPGFIRSLDIPPIHRGDLIAAVRRHRSAYPAQLAWVVQLSRLATGNATATAARAWRIAAADTWGPDRWSRLAAATGLSEAELRAQATQLTA